MFRYSLLISFLFITFGLEVTMRASVSPKQNTTLTITDLKTEYLKNPLGVDTKHPRFSWKLESKERGRQQKAYQILVASTPDLLSAGKADMWNSRETTFAEEVNIVYKGKPLKSDQTYYWKVRVWTQDSDAWSETQRFHTGLFQPSDWQGSWISSQDTTISAPLLRREFSLDKSIRKATAFVTGVGYYEFYLNGHKVGNHVLDPAITDYRKRILYATYDVTDQLREGANAAGIILGNGAWRMPTMKARYTWKNHTYGRPRAILQLNIRFKDGSETHIVTNKNWTANAGPIVYNNIYGGEDYDARKEQPGWSTADFDDEEWESVREVKEPGGELASQMMPPIKVVQTIKPKRRIHSAENVYLFDLGQNIPGWWRIRVRGDRGTKLKIRGAETLNDSLFPATLKKGDRLSTNKDYHKNVWTTYTLKGEGTETYEPRFFYTGYRYLEVFVDNPTGLQSLEVEGRVVHSDLKRNGYFSSSDSLLDKIYEAAVWSQRGNLHGYPTDCPHREKGGYTGDGQVIAEASMHDFHMHPFYKKWLNDMRDAQRDNGRIPNTAPTVLGGHGGGIAWGSAYILLPWWMYQYYDDKRILREHYATMKRYMKYLKNLAAENDKNPDKGFIINEFGGYWDSLGEWEAPVGDRTGPVNPLTNTYYWYLDSMTFAKIAEVLGKQDDHTFYLALADSIKNAFNRKFFNSSTNLYGTDNLYQSYLLFALAGKMVPEEHREAVLDNLINDILVASNGHLSTGILGTKHLFEVLTKEERKEVLHRVVIQKTFPSWGYWIKNGATTLWESWNGESSHNHQMFGSVNEYFYKYLAGIRAPTDEGTTAGYKKIHIKPYVPDNLAHAEAIVQTVRGRVSSSWQHDGDGLSMNVTLPANTTGKVSIPTLDFKNIVVIEKGKVIWEDGKFQNGVDAIEAGYRKGDFIIFQIQSGSYEFEIQSH